MCMRRFLGLCLIVLGTANVACAQKPDWKLVWEDNFDGNSLDYSKWECEIDIMELRGQTPNETLGTLHFGKSWPDNELTKEPPFRLKAGSFADDFHTFSLEWEKGVMRWFVDDQLFQTVTKWNSVGGEFPAPFDQPFHMILNVAVGGGFVGNPDASTTYPQQMQVDFVRVYSR